MSPSQEDEEDAGEDSRPESVRKSKEDLQESSLAMAWMRGGGPWELGYEMVPGLAGRLLLPRDSSVD